MSKRELRRRFRAQTFLFERTRSLPTRLRLSRPCEAADNNHTDDRNSPVEDAQNLSGPQERDLVLALRLLARQELDLRPLSDAELRDWQYSPPSPLPPPMRQLRPAYPRYEPPSEVFEALLGRVQRDEPELLRALDAVAAENALRSHRKDRPLSMMWLAFQVGRHVRTSMPHLGGVDQADVVEAVLDRTTARATG